MISKQIQKNTQSLTDRGIPEHSHFTLHFQDGSSVSEQDTNWSDVGETTVCGYFGGKKTVCLSKYLVNKIHIRHGLLEKELNVPVGHRVYQAIRTETLFSPGQKNMSRVVGRCVGLVKDGQVVEEYFLDGVRNEVSGVRA